MLVPVMVSGKGALALVCSRLIEAFHSDVVVYRSMPEVIENCSCSYKLMRLRLVLVRNQFTEQSTDDGRLAKGSSKVVGGEVSKRPAK